MQAQRSNIMTIEQAEAEYERLKWLEMTAEEYAEAMKELCRQGRASGYYRPAQKLTREGDPYP